MSEVLGNAEPNDELLDDDEDGAEDLSDLDDLDDLDDDDAASAGLLATFSSPTTLAITALVLATVSLIGLLSSYLLSNAIALAHTGADTLFVTRVGAAVELGLGLLAALFGFLAHSAAFHHPERESQRAARAMAGAAIVLAVVSILESGGSLIIMAGAHAATGTGG